MCYSIYYQKKNTEHKEQKPEHDMSQIEGHDLTNNIHKGYIPHLRDNQRKSINKGTRKRREQTKSPHHKQWFDQILW